MQNPDNQEGQVYNNEKPNTVVVEEQAAIPQPSPPQPQAIDPTPPKPKNKFKKIGIILIGVVFLVIVILLFIRLLSGSGRQSPDSNEPITLRWWGHWEDPAVIKPIIDAYQAENPKVTIVYESQSKTDYRERLTNAFAQGKGPDIMRIHNTWIPMYQSVLAPLPGSVMTPQEYFETFYVVAVNDSTVTKGIVAMPLQYDNLALYINLDIYSAYALETPSTWEEVLANASQVSISSRNREIQQAGIALGNTQNVDHWEEIFGLMVLQNGNFDPNSTVTPGSLESNLVQNAVDYYVNAADRAGWSESLPNSTDAFALDIAAMFLGPHSRLAEIKAKNPDINIGIIPAPQIVNDPSTVKISYASYWTEAVNSSGANPLEAWKFLKYAAERENLETLNQNLLEVDGYGEIPSRSDMRESALLDPSRAGFVRLAPWSKSWYFADDTKDGETGINTQLSNAYAEAISKNSLKRSSENINEVLNKYGIR